VIVGNHDAFYKNTLEVNSVDLLLEEYDNISTYVEPEVIEVGGCEIMLVPWICEQNEEKTFVMADKTSAQVLFGHLELAGYEMYKGGIIDHGISDQWLKKFDLVCSGHYHHKSRNGCINYLGTAYEITWSDYNDQKGFHIFDTATRELEFVENPHKLFHKVWYDDTDLDMTGLLKQCEQFDDYKGCSITDHLHLDLEDDSDIIDEAEDTLTILDSYVDGLEIKNDKQDLSLLLRSLYDEALSIS
jgi:DNA repair exonuclease SbcCD nuclease subunit